MHLEEVSRADDLWSVFYMSMELMGIKLPWRPCGKKNEVLDMHLCTSLKDLCQNLPPEFEDFGTHLEGLEWVLVNCFEFMVFSLNYFYLFFVDFS